MKKLYVIIFFTLCSFFAISTMEAQNNSSFHPSKERIEGLAIYPNPVSTQTNTVTIASSKNLIKKISIFNVLGKQVLQINLIGKSLNISNLSKGVYILNITENNISETRKLVIK
ncbi:T9SS type A sorting domain-containing protein [Algibacter miyuki]|uniref:T9SS type A sorting domain-containing protein n=1 Tax=Algibacter miyuki TaxID=1306933 RepID=A0ABV5GUK8_9FLAO|nr:T9SS type A sorting domain-containing protein [Algibacter miyuki]MDN3664640.1 T9SS type A sorting domain-containing protein [Algibacter miyuki]